MTEPFRQAFSDEDLKVIPRIDPISEDDLIREFSRGNFKHVNDTNNSFSEDYCKEVVAKIKELQRAYKHIYDQKKLLDVRFESMLILREQVKKLEALKAKADEMAEDVACPHPHYPNQYEAYRYLIDKANAYLEAAKEIE